MSNTKAKLAILATSVLLAGNVNANEQIYDYVVVGAGAAGLSAAYTLQELNESFIVLEKMTVLVVSLTPESKVASIMLKGRNTSVNQKDSLQKSFKTEDSIG